ncbi:MAG: endonuclease III [Desulfovibrio sp.]|jgi:endonuclease-3|nr:endonuclease III [Desulfovibrio sp.]
MDKNRVRERAERMLGILQARYPVSRGFLKAETPWQLLVATQLSAQCTDERVNSVTPALFSRLPTPREMADADVCELESLIRPTGFYRNKARNLIGAARRVLEVYGGEVPGDMESLLTLPGIARKSANVVLYGAYGINAGLAVDTHVGRIARRLDLTRQQDPVRVEKDLLPLFPQDQWGSTNHRMVSFGREVCKARGPFCKDCEANVFCPRIGL